MSHVPVPEEPATGEDLLSWAYSHPSPSDKLVSPTSKALGRRGGIFGGWGAAAASAPAASGGAALGSLSSTTYAATLAARAAASSLPSAPAARIPSRLASAPVTTWQVLAEALPEVPAAEGSCAAPTALAAAQPTPVAAAAAVAVTSLSSSAMLPPRSPEPRSLLQRAAARQALSHRGLANASANGDSSSSSILASAGTGSTPSGSSCSEGVGGGAGEEDAFDLIPVRRDITGAAMADVRLSGSKGCGAAAAPSESSCAQQQQQQPIFSGWETFDAAPPLLPAPATPKAAAGSGLGSIVGSPRGITFFR